MPQRNPGPPTGVKNRWPPDRMSKKGGLPKISNPPGRKFRYFPYVSLGKILSLEQFNLNASFCPTQAPAPSHAPVSSQALASSQAPVTSQALREGSLFTGWGAAANGNPYNYRESPYVCLIFTQHTI